MCIIFFFFSSRRRHTRYWRDWSSDVCSSDLYFTPEQISSGALDPLIDAQAASIKAAGIPFVLDLMHEVDTTTEKMDDVTARPEYGGTAPPELWGTPPPLPFRHRSEKHMPEHHCCPYLS